jgi:hypothetical protein
MTLEIDTTRAQLLQVCCANNVPDSIIKACAPLWVLSIHDTHHQVAPNVHVWLLLCRAIGSREVHASEEWQAVDAPCPCSYLPCDNADSKLMPISSSPRYSGNLTYVSSSCQCMWCPTSHYYCCNANSLRIVPLLLVMIHSIVAGTLLRSVPKICVGNEGVVDQVGTCHLGLRLLITEEMYLELR